MEDRQTHPTKYYLTLETFYDEDKKLYLTKKPQKKKGLKQRLTTLFKTLKA